MAKELSPTGWTGSWWEVAAAPQDPAAELMEANEKRCTLGRPQHLGADKTGSVRLVTGVPRPTLVCPDVCRPPQYTHMCH